MGALRVDSGILRARKRYGAIAQLGERLHGMQEVDGSIPSGSTIKINNLRRALNPASDAVPAGG